MFRHIQKIIDFFTPTSRYIYHCKKRDINDFNFQEFYVDYLILCDDELTLEERRNNVNVYLSKFDEKHQEMLDNIISLYSYHKDHYKNIVVDIVSIICGVTKNISKSGILYSNFDKHIGISYVFDNDRERYRPTIGNIKAVIQEKYADVDFVYNERLETVSKYC